MPPGGSPRPSPSATRWAAGYSTDKMNYLRFTRDQHVPPDNNGSEVRHPHDQTSTESQRLPTYEPSPEPDNTARSAATYPPPPSTAGNFLLHPRHTRRGPPVATPASM